MKIKKDIFENERPEDLGVRINKYIADSGICSRREADTLIAAGKVSINGLVAEMGSRVHEGDSVSVNGKDISKNEDLILIAFNKPIGIVCTTDRRDPDNIIDYISYGKRIFPIGRLDKDSEGLILLTNDGDIVNKILRAGNNHEKEYIVRVNKQITPEFLHAMSSGVPILDTVTRPCTIEQLDNFTFRIILTQGLNRQIRRMCEALGYRVRALTRVRIMNINLGRLKTGTYRNLTDYELAGLKDLIDTSSNAPVRDLSEHKAQVITRDPAPKARPGFEKDNKKRAGNYADNTSDSKTGRVNRTSFAGGKSLRTGRPRDNK